VRLQQTQNTSAGNEAFDPTVTHHRQFVYILPVYDLNCLADWSIGRKRAQVVYTGIAGILL
jgi:hypothetical protein